MARKRSLIALQIFTYLFLRWWFIPLEFTGDSYGYACEVIKNDLQSGHHLLHKYVLNFFYEQYNHSYYDSEYSIHSSYNPLIIFIRFNLILSVLNLCIVWLILEQRRWKLSSISLALLFLSSTFSFMKYSFENETYMLPLFFSLLGTYFFERQKWKMSFTLLSIAALFHQIHIFWLLALWLHSKVNTYKKITLLLFCISIIGLTYLGFSLANSTGVTQLFFHDVNNGLVQIVPTLNNFVLSGINIIRVFFQIHGELLVFWKVFNPFLSGIAIISCLFTMIGVVLYIGAHKFTFRKSDWSTVYITAFVFQLLFAIYSVGNIEFMIVLPFLLVLANKTGRILNYSLLISLGMFLWNFGQFALPRTSVSPHRLHQKFEFLSNINFRNKDSLVIAIDDKDLHQNYFEYQTLIEKSPLKLICVDLDEMSKSDIVILHEKPNFSRSSFTSEKKSIEVKANQKIYIDSSVMGNLTVITN